MIRAYFDVRGRHFVAPLNPDRPSATQHFIPDGVTDIDAVSPADFRGPEIGFAREEDLFS